jgi:tetratricopeptide (TPR) repeat protein
MKIYGVVFVLLATCSAFAQKGSGANFSLVLPGHHGQLAWVASGFKVIESSAKASGLEIGIRGEENSGRLAFLGFLFLVPKEGGLTSAKCRDESMAEEKRDAPSLKVLRKFELGTGGDLPISQVTYSTGNRDGSTQYHVRGFIASGDICGDLEIYSKSPVDERDSELAKIFSTFRFNVSYIPEFGDVVLYGQILYDAKNFAGAAPIFEEALTMIPAGGAPFPSAKVARRVLTDQAGMAYGISGNLSKSRSIFEAGIAADPTYPLYYYNLACADAGQNKLADARAHLQQAFAHRADLIPGEEMPDPTTDDSFTPFEGNQQFWAFVKSLNAKK